MINFVEIGPKDFEKIQDISNFTSVLLEDGVYDVKFPLTFLCKKGISIKARNNASVILQGKDCIMRVLNCSDFSLHGLCFKSLSEHHNILSDNNVRDSSSKSSTDPQKSSIKYSNATIVFAGDFTSAWVQNCTIDCSMLSGISVCRLAKVIILGSFIKDCKESAVWIYNASAVIEGTQILKAELNGIFVSGSSKNVEIVNNTFTHCKLSGIYVAASSNVLIKRNLIKESQCSNLTISENAIVNVEQNKISDSLKNGILCRQKAIVKIIDNEIFNNRMFNMLFADESKGSVENNIIFDGYEGGIWMTDKASPHLLKNTIRNNQQRQISMSGNCNPIIQQNFIFAGNGKGISCKEQSRGQIISNEIHQNQSENIGIYGTSCPHIERNKIFDGKFGIAIHDKCECIIQHNEILKNDVANIFVSGGANPLITKNLIADGPQCGIFIGKHSGAIIKENEISKNRFVNVDIQPKSKPVLIDNNIHSSITGICFREMSKARLGHNNLYSNMEDMKLERNSSPSFI